MSTDSAKRSRMPKMQSCVFRTNSVDDPLARETFRIGRDLFLRVRQRSAFIVGLANQ